MAWLRTLFKGRSRVWVRVDDRGIPVLDRGRCQVAFSRGDARTYLASPDNLTPLPSPERVEDADWAAAAKPPDPPAPKEEAPAAAPAPDPKKPARPTAVRGKRRSAVRIFTDGACLGNPGPAAAAALLQYRGREKELVRYLGNGTNNIAELEAVRLGLLAVKDRTVPVDLHTDSTYAIGVLTLGWQPKANRERVAEILELVREFRDLRLVKVAGHAGVSENERVDGLARAAAEAGRLG